MSDDVPGPLRDDSARVDDDAAHLDALAVQALTQQVQHLRAELAQALSDVDDRDRDLVALRATIVVRDAQIAEKDLELQHRAEVITRLTRWRRLIPARIRVSMRRGPR